MMTLYCTTSVFVYGYEVTVVVFAHETMKCVKSEKDRPPPEKGLYVSPEDLLLCTVCLGVPKERGGSIFLCMVNELSVVFGQRTRWLGSRDEENQMRCCFFSVIHKIFFFFLPGRKAGERHFAGVGSVCYP